MNDSNEQYNVYFAGELQSGQEAGRVRENLRKLFKANDATLDKLFSGTPQLIKRQCDKATALKFKQALERAGAIPVVKSAALNGPQAPNEPQAPSEPQAPEAQPASGPQAGPEHEPESEHSTASDDGDFSLAAPGARLSEEASPPPPAPDTSHISLAPTGSDVLEDEYKRKDTAEAPDTSHIQLVDS